MNEQLVGHQEGPISQAFSISDFYQLLSISLQVPSVEFAEALLDGRYKEDVNTILTELSCSFEDVGEVEKLLEQIEKSGNDVHQVLGNLRIEHTRLFYDPKRPALDIYETTFTKKTKDLSEKPTLFVSPEALQVEQCYKEAGLVMTTKEPADHMVIELEFMMDLYRKKGLAIRDRDEQRIELIQGQINKFEEGHLRKWAYDFFSKLESETTNDSYHAIAKLAKVGLSQLLL